MLFGYKNGTLLGFRYRNSEGQNELRSVIFCKEWEKNGQHFLACIDVRDRKREVDERKANPEKPASERFKAVPKWFITSRITSEMIVENATAMAGKIKNKHAVR